MYIPLIAYQVADAPLILHNGQRITRARFLAELDAFAAHLSATKYVINLCQNRYYFLLTFAAACLRGQTNLLPASQATGALQALADEYPAHQVVDDKLVSDWLAAQSIAIPKTCTWPSIAADHIAAIAFTSGSTGKPQGHICTWSILTGSARRSAGRIFTHRELTIVATVPPQHMFGLETTILQPLANSCAVHSEKPFFPAEIFSTLRKVGTPCALITTPAHLKNCFAATTEPPQVEFVLSATAPLDPALAASVEQQWDTQVLEIYGSTETGAIATRRTSQGDAWHLMEGGSLKDSQFGIEYHPDGASQFVLLHDTLLRSDPTHFALGARNHDLIKVAGKRASLAELNVRLLAIPGVVDGVIFQPQADNRVAALVVVATINDKEITSSEIQTALAAHIDSVFLPRPLRIVKSLPRDAVGKLPRAQLIAALERD